MQRPMLIGLIWFSILSPPTLMSYQQVPECTDGAVIEAGESEEAEGRLLEILEECRRLSILDPDRYKSVLLSALVELGWLYHDSGSKEKTEGIFLERLEISRETASLDPSPENRLQVAYIHLLLGELAFDLGRMDDAERAYHEALQIQREFSDAEVFLNRFDLARTLTELGVLYRATNRLGESERAFLESLGLRRELSSKEANNNSIRRTVAESLNSLANLYRDTGRVGEAEAAYLKALAILRVFPDRFSSILALVLKNLAQLYAGQARNEEAYELRREEVPIRQRLAASDVENARMNLAYAVAHQAYLGFRLGKYLEQEDALREAIPILRDLSINGPTQLQIELLWSLRSLAIIEYEKKSFDEAATVFHEAIGVGKRLWQGEPERHGNLYASLLLAVSRLPQFQNPETLCQFGKDARKAATDDRLKDPISAVLAHCPESPTVESSTDPR